MFKLTCEMCDHWVSCRPFEKIGANHFLRGWGRNRVEVCSVAHQLSSYLGRLERGYATRNKKCDFLSSQLSTSRRGDVLGRMGQSGSDLLPLEPSRLVSFVQ